MRRRMQRTAWLAMIALGGASQVFPVGMAGAQTSVSTAAANYQIGASDLLNITVYQSADLTTTERVASDGSIDFPILGKVDVAGKVASDVASEIASMLAAKGILVHPSVNVLVAEVRSKIVSVMGAVTKPGDIPLDQPGMTIAQVLARAGASFGSGSAIVTVLDTATHQGREQFAIGQVVSGVKDREVRPGEMLVVQAAPTVYVSGEVGRPGAYPLEVGMTVGQAIALGGGITPRGSRNRVKLTRTQGAAKEELHRITMDTPVVADDLIVVQTRVF